MTMTELIFWVSVGCIVYTYVGYPLLLFVLSALRQLRADWRFVSSGESRRSTDGAAEVPSVAVLVAAHNEERHIAARVRNLLASDYPPDRLRIYIGSDGSTDGTEREVQALRGERVRWFGFTQRRGKPSVLNDLAAQASEDILVFTDANTEFRDTTIRRLVRHFTRPEVGCVSGELRLVAAAGGDNPDHLYWRYERLLKYFEARLDALLGANGGVYAVRRALFRPIPANTIVDDFWISMRLIAEGHRCVYDPEASATETVPEKIRDEFRRRVRIGIGNYQAMRRFATLLNPMRGYLALSFLSHKCLRWLVPHFMVVALAANLALADIPLYRALLVTQLVFYALAIAGYWRGRAGMVPRPLRVPAFFLGMNAALLVGSWKYLTGKFGGAWARTER